jgi:hypothetical protein
LEPRYIASTVIPVVELLLPLMTMMESSDLDKGKTQLGEPPCGALFLTLLSTAFQVMGR